MKTQFVRKLAEDEEFVINAKLAGGQKIHNLKQQWEQATSDIESWKRSIEELKNELAEKEAQLIELEKVYTNSTSELCDAIFTIENVVFPVNDYNDHAMIKLPSFEFMQFNGFDISSVYVDNFNKLIKFEPLYTKSLILAMCK